MNILEKKSRLLVAMRVLRSRMDCSAKLYADLILDGDIYNIAEYHLKGYARWKSFYSQTKTIYNSLKV